MPSISQENLRRFPNGFKCVLEALNGRIPLNGERDRFDGQLMQCI